MTLSQINTKMIAPSSCSSSNLCRPSYLTNNHESFSCFLYAVYVYISSMVVVILGDAWASYDIPGIFYPLPALEHTCSHFRQHSDAYCHADSGWRSSGQCAGSWRRNYCRCLGSPRKRQSHGHFLSWPTHGSSTGTHHRRCSSREIRVEEYTVVSSDIRGGFDNIFVIRST